LKNLANRRENLPLGGSRQADGRSLPEGWFEFEEEIAPECRISPSDVEIE
jgi:hypothetical protein